MLTGLTTTYLNNRIVCSYLSTALRRDGPDSALREGHALSVAATADADLLGGPRARSSATGPARVSTCSSLHVVFAATQNQRSGTSTC